MCSQCTSDCRKSLVVQLNPTVNALKLICALKCLTQFGQKQLLELKKNVFTSWINVYLDYFEHLVHIRASTQVFLYTASVNIYTHVLESTVFYILNE